MASSRLLLLPVLITAACLLGTVSSSYCGKDKTQTIGPFYWTDVLALPNATDFIVASIDGNKKVRAFGDLTVFNDPLMSGPLLTDPQIGRAQGFFAHTDPVNLVGGLTVFSFVFPDGTITFNCYFKASLLVPNETNRCGVTSGNGGYRGIVRGYTDLAYYSSTAPGQGVVTGTVIYCL